MSDPRKDLRLDFLVQELTKMAEKIDGVIARSESNCVDEVVAEAKAATQQVKAKFLQLTGEIEHLKQCVDAHTAHLDEFQKMTEKDERILNLQTAVLKEVQDEWADQMANGNKQAYMAECEQLMATVRELENEVKIKRAKKVELDGLKQELAALRKLEESLKAQLPKAN